MRICFFYYDFFEHGGIARVVARLANYLSYKHDVELLCTSPFNINRNPYHLSVKRIASTRIDLLPKYKLNRQNIIEVVNRKIIKGKNKKLQQWLSRIYHSKLSKNTLIKFIDSKQYDLVIGCSLPFSLLLGDIAPKVKCKVWAWEHNSYDSYFGIKGYLEQQKEIYKIYINRLDQIITVNHKDLIYYKSNFDVQVVNLSNPISFETKLRSNCKEKIILTIGRIDNNKGFDILLDIFEEFSKHYSDWTLKIIGEGCEEEKIKKKIKENRLNAQIYPFTNEILQEYLQASIYTCTSKYESFGLTVLEAMSCGLPVVSFNSVGPKEIIEQNNNGYVIDYGDKVEFEKALEKLAGDREKRIELGERGIETARQYKPENILPLWDMLLDQL